MSIIDITRDFAENPNIVRVMTTDTLSAVSAANYLLGQQANIEALNSGVWTWQPSDMVLLYATDGLGFFTISSDMNSFIPFAFSTTFTGSPAAAGDFAVFSSTSGNIEDLGYLPSNAAKTNIVMANGASIVNHIATYTDTAGTIGEDAATAINAGNIQAGLSGTAGLLRSYPAAANTGFLQLQSVASSGNFSGTISNASLGQSVVWTLADPVSATSRILQAGAALVSGNLVKASGVAGLIVDAAFALHAGTTAAFAGGGVTNTFVTTNMTASSIVTAVILASTNAVSIVKALPGTNTLAVTFSADPGAGTTISWVSVTPAG
jgi:hypothetical protein